MRSLAGASRRAAATAALGLGVLGVLGLLAWAPPLASAAPPPAPRSPAGTPPSRATSQEGPTPTSPAPGPPSVPDRPTRSRVTFLGWSPDGRYVAYRRERWRPPRHPGGPVRYRDRTLHREVRAARLRGYGPPLKPDPATYLTAHHYFLRALPREHAGPGTLVFHDEAGGEPLRLSVTPGRQLSWSLTRGGRLLATRPFDRLYIALDAQLFPSPRGDVLAVVLTLDTGWRVDAALYLVAAPP